MAHGVLGLLLHLQHAHGVVDRYHPRALQFFQRRLVVAHDDGGAASAEEVDKALHGEGEHIVGGHYQNVVVHLAGVECQQQVAHGTQTGGIVFRAVVDDADGVAVVALLFPRVEVVGKLVVGHYDVLVDAFYLVYVAQHAVQNGAAAYLKQRLGKILRERIKTGGIAGCYHNGLHKDGL